MAGKGLSVFELNKVHVFSAPPCCLSSIASVDKLDKAKRGRRHLWKPWYFPLFLSSVGKPVMKADKNLNSLSLSFQMLFIYSLKYILLCKVLSLVPSMKYCFLISTTNHPVSLMRWSQSLVDIKLIWECQCYLISQIVCCFCKVK